MTTATFRSEPFVWGTEVVRSPSGFLGYEPRRRRLTELLLDASRWSDRDHLVQGPRRLTYGEFLAAVDAVAAELSHRGAGDGRPVLLAAANSPEWVVTFWAAARAGAVLALGNGWWSEEEVAHAVGLIEPALVVGDARRLERMPAGVAVLSIDEVRGMVDGAAAGSPEPPAAPPDSRGGEDDPALVVFTSGTTGLPKGAVLSHRAVIANLHNLMATSGRLPHTLPDDHRGYASLVTGPLFHIGGVQAMSLALVTGATLVFLEGRFDATEVLDIIERERITVWGAVPTMALRVLDDPTLPRRDLTSVRSISLGGSPVPPEAVTRLQAVFPNARRGVSNVYGMTETGGTVAAAPGALMVEHPGTAGRPSPVVELRIDRPDAAGVGEILVRTPGQMSGYWGEGGGGIDEDGFVHTGDLGRLEDGLLYVTGRSKDVIIRGGENIAAPHVESALLGHPEVASVAVVGLPHPDLGEEVGAAVVSTRGAALTAEDLADFAASRLAHFEVPTRWWLRSEELPTNDAGKVDKRALQAGWPAG